jgi:Domain of unknown function (DUF5664)
MAFSYDEPIRYNEGKVDWTYLPWDYSMMIEMEKTINAFPSSWTDNIEGLIVYLENKEVFKCLCSSLVLWDNQDVLLNTDARINLPWKSLEQVCRVFAFGASKYARDNYKLAPGLPLENYIQSMWRHTVSYLRGEELDTDSGLPNLAHLACNCFMYLWTQEEYHTNK